MAQILTFSMRFCRPSFAKGLAAVGLISGLISSLFASGAPAIANESAQPSYCYTPYVIVDGQLRAAAPVQNNDQHAESCSGNPGDLWTDGPLQNPTISYSGSSFSFVVPALNWYAGGNRIYTPATPITVGANATTYIWADYGAFPAVIRSTTTNIASTLTSVLEYTVTSNGGGVTSIPNPPYPKLKIPGLAVNANICTDSSGNLTTGGCGNGTVTGITPGTGISVGGSASTPTVAISPLPLPPSMGGTGSTNPTPSASPPITQLGSYPNLTYLDYALPSNLKNLGAACNGSDDKATINAATWPNSNVPLSGCLANQATTAFADGHLYGLGTITAVNSATNRVQARDMITVLTPPAYNGQWGTIQSGFDGDQSHIALPFQVYTAPNAIATPSAGYAISPMVSGIAGDCEMGSGYQDPVTRPNRTEDACVKIAVKVDASAGGDNAAFNAQVSIGSTQVNSTWPGETAGILYNGQDNATSNNVYLNPFELHMGDNGFDVSEVASFMRLTRTNGTGGNGNVWQGYDIQSAGSAPVDSFYSTKGASFLGLDFTKSTFTGCAICLPPNAGVYFDATNSGQFSRCVTPGTAFLQYNSATNNLEANVGGALEGSFGSAGFSAVDVNLSDPNPLRFTGSTTKFSSTSVPGYQFDTTGGGLLGLFTASNSSKFEVLGNGGTVANKTSTASGFVIGSIAGSPPISNLTTCDFCDGQLGSATPNVFKVSNDEVASTSYTVWGAPDAAAVQGIQNSAFGIADTGTPDLAADANGNFGFRGSVFATNFYGSGLTPGQCIQAATLGELSGYTCPNLQYVSTGQISVQTSATPLQFVPASTCGTTSPGCSSGVVTLVTPAVAPPGTTRYLVTAKTWWGLSTAISSESLMGCVTTSASVTSIDSFPVGSNPCVGGTSGTTGTKLLGTVQFGNTSAGSGSGLLGQSEAQFYVAAGTTVPLNCYLAGSTSTQQTANGGCSMRAVAVP